MKHLNSVKHFLIFVNIITCPVKSYQSLFDFFWQRGLKLEMEGYFWAQ